jgi:hypothetical protein
MNDISIKNKLSYKILSYITLIFAIFFLLTSIIVFTLLVNDMKYSILPYLIYKNAFDISILYLFSGIILLAIYLSNYYKPSNNSVRDMSITLSIILLVNIVHASMIKMHVLNK